jgi:hypothetical protein
MEMLVGRQLGTVEQLVVAGHEMLRRIEHHDSPEYREAQLTAFERTHVEGIVGRRIAIATKDWCRYPGLLVSPLTSEPESYGGISKYELTMMQVRGISGVVEGFIHHADEETDVMAGLIFYEPNVMTPERQIYKQPFDFMLDLGSVALGRNNHFFVA